jgi:8-oxo-dGTP diphosphatase
MLQQMYHVAVALIRRGDAVLLVHQQAPHDSAPTWALPGGGAEHGELLTEVLVREVREETGLEVDQIGHVAYIIQYDQPMEGYQSLVVVFEIAAWHGDVHIADPDRLILDASFMPVSEALAKIDTLPWRRMREPLVAHLTSTAPPGNLWLYRQQGSMEQQVARIAPPPSNVQQHSR